MDYFNLMLSLATGAATGYVTNDYAVKMLFEKVCGVGNVIVQTKPQFIENVSRLIERDIINDRTIESELTKFESQRIFYKIITDMLQYRLYTNTADTEIRRIAGMAVSMQNFSDFYERQAERFCRDFLHTLIALLEMDKIARPEQRILLARNVWQISIDVLQDSDCIAAVVHSIYCQQRTRKIGSLIHPGILRAAAGNITRHTANFHLLLQANFDRDIDKTITAAYDYMGFASTAQALEQSIGNKTLYEVLGRDNAANIAGEIRQVIIQLLKSEAGQVAVEDFTRQMLAIGRSLDISLLALLNEGMAQRLENYLRDSLPEILAKVIRWIKANTQELEDLTNQAVDDVLAEESEGFFSWRGKAKQTLKKVFYEDVAGKQEFVRKVIDKLEQSADIDTLSIEAADLIIAYLQQKTISQIIVDLENRGVLRSVYLVRLINHNLDTTAANINMAVFDSFFQNRLGDILSLPIAAYLEKLVQESLIPQWKADYLYSAHGTELLQREIKRRSQVLPKLTLQTACGGIDAGRLAELLQQQVLAALRANQEQAAGRLAKVMSGQLAGKVSCFVGDDMLKSLIAMTAQQSIAAVQKAIDDWSGQPVKLIYDRLNSRGTTGKELTGLLIFALNENLPALLEGKIQVAVAANLQQLPDIELQTMVKNFMGRELQPINRLGAVLGLGTGLLMYYEQGALNVSNNYLNTLTNMAVYGFTGYFTNVLALKMIFRPYRPWLLLGRQVPLTPGVVAKQKSGFAASMAEFVDKSLLSPASANNLFAAKRPELEQTILQKIAADNYLLPLEVLRRNTGLLSAGAVGLAGELIRRNHRRLVEDLARELNGINLSGLNSANINKAAAGGCKLREQLQEWLVERLHKIMQSPRSTLECLPEFARQAIHMSCEQLAAAGIRAAVGFLRDDRQVERLLQDWNGHFKRQTEHSLQYLLTDVQVEQLKQLATDLLVSKLRSPAAVAMLSAWLEGKLAAEFHPDKPLAELFDGALITLLRNNGGFIVDSIIEGGITWLRQNRRKLQQDMYCRFNGQNDWTMKVADKVLNIEKTVYRLVDELIDTKLPGYLRRKQVELRTILFDFIDGRLAGTNAAELGITFNAGGIADFIEQLLDHKNSTVLIRGLVEIAVDFIVRLPLNKLLAVAGIHNLTDISRIFAREIAELRAMIADNLEKNQHQLQQHTVDLLWRLVREAILNISCKDLSRGITRDMTAQSVQKVSAVVAACPAVHQEWRRFQQVVISEVSFKQLGEIADCTMLAEDIIHAVEQTINENKSVWDKTVRDMLTVIIDQINSIVSSETKDYIAQIAVKSFLDSVAVHFHSLVTAVNVKEITERQINSMTPEEIEAMFQSFAQPYFRKLELYGAIFGALLGLVSSGAGKTIGMFNR